MAAKRKSKTKPSLTDNEQSERFKQTARDLDIEDKDARAFERAFAKLVPVKRAQNERKQ